MSDTRESLRLTAEHLLRTIGYSGFSFADVSNAVGIRKASIHYHYPTKELLVLSVLQGYAERYRTALVAIEQTSEDALARIDAYGRLYLAGIDKGLGCLCAALSAELESLPESLKSETVKFFREHTAWLQKIYSEGLAKGEVNSDFSAAEAARLVLTSLEGGLLVERLLDGRRGLESTLSALSKAFLPRGQADTLPR